MLNLPLDALPNAKRHPSIVVDLWNGDFLLFMWEDFKKNRVLYVFRHYEDNKAVWIKRMGTKFGETCDLKAMQVSKTLVVIFSDKSQYVE